MTDMYDATIAINTTSKCSSAFCIYEKYGATHCEFYRILYEYVHEDHMTQDMNNTLMALRHWKDIIHQKRALVLTDKIGVISTLHPSSQDLRRYRSSVEQDSKFQTVINFKVTPKDDTLIAAVTHLSNAEGNKGMYDFYSRVEQVVPACKFKDVTNFVDVRVPGRANQCYKRTAYALVGVLLLVISIMIIVFASRRCS